MWDDPAWPRQPCLQWHKVTTSQSPSICWRTSVGRRRSTSTVITILNCQRERSGRERESWSDWSTPTPRSGPLSCWRQLSYAKTSSRPNFPDMVGILCLIFRSFPCIEATYSYVSIFEPMRGEPCLDIPRPMRANPRYSSTNESGPGWLSVRE